MEGNIKIQTYKNFLCIFLIALSLSLHICASTYNPEELLTKSEITTMKNCINRYRNIWDPSYSDVVSEISNGRPALLGFKAGEESYSTTAGHMTMYIGAATTVVENSYVSLVDGHQLSIVTKLWDPNLNDFICSLTVGVS